MNTYTKSLIVVLVCVVCIVMSGCSAGANALLELKVLPNAHAYLGKGVEGVAKKAINANLIRKGIDSGIVTTSEEIRQLDRMGF